MILIFRFLTVCCFCGRLSAQAADPVISLSSVRVAEGNAGSTAVGVPVYLSSAAAGPVTVQWTTADGTASAGSDYTAASGTLTFAPGEIFKTVTVQVTGDTADEFDETFTVNFSAPSGAVLAETQAVARIREDELVTVPVLPQAVNIIENQTTGLPGIVVINPAAGRSVKLALNSGSATAGTDITLTSADIDASVAAMTLPLSVTGNNQPEADKTFSLALVNPGPGVKVLSNSLTQTLPAGPPPVAMAVQDDLLVTANGADLRIFRQTAGSWALEQTVPGASEGGVAGVAVDQGVIAADFKNTGVKIFKKTGNLWTSVKTLILPPAAAGLPRRLALQDGLLAIGDAAADGGTGKVRIHERHLGGQEGWGERQILLSAGQAPDFGSALSLWGDHLVVGAPGAYAVSLFKRNVETRQWAAVKEFVRFTANFGKTCAVDGSRVVLAAFPQLLTSRRLDESGAAWSDLVSQNVGAGSGDPWISLNGGLLCAKYGDIGVRYFCANATGGWDSVDRSLPSLAALPVARQFAWDGQTTVMTGNGDATAAPLAVYSAGAAPGLIVDDESVRFTVEDAFASESQNLTKVTLSRPLPVRVAVKYSFVDGTAVLGSDYNGAGEDTLQFDPGQTVANLRYYIQTPEAGEGQEVFYIKLDPFMLGTVGPDATVTIGGQPPFPLLTMVTSSQAEAEGNSGQKAVAIRYHLSAPAPAGASFAWSTLTDAPTNSATAGSDFVAGSGVVQVPAGATDGSFNVSILGDTIGEWEERFSVVLSNPVKLSTVSYQVSTAVHITNDDTGIPVNDSYTMAQGGVLSGVDVRANDTRILEVTTESTDSGRTLLYNGQLTYTPAPNFIGQYTFDYHDRYLVQEIPVKIAKVTITVTDANLPPAIAADSFTTREDTPLDLTTSAATLLTNDGVLNGQGVAYDPILEIGIAEVLNGAVTNTTLDGRFTFTPPPDFSGTGSFRYRLRDKDGWSGYATVTVRVNDDLPLPPLQRLNPAGSQLFRAISSSTAFPAAGVVDYPLSLRAGQTLSLRAVTANGTLGRLELRNGSGQVMPGGTAGTNSLENIPIPADGVYKIFAGDRGTNGNGTLTALVNGGLPPSSLDVAGAYPLDAARPAGSPRAAAAAILSGGLHYYKFTGAADESVQLYLQSNTLMTFTLQQPAGTVLASSTVSSADSKACLLRFTLPSAGTFLVPVKGSTGAADYTLQLYRGAEIHDFAAPPPAPLSTRGSGYLSGRGVPESGTPEPMITFAAFGDYGSGSVNEAAVATMVKSWNPDFILTAGDHNYQADYVVGTPTWKTTVGDFYGSFIKSRADNRYPEQTSNIQRYFTATGNHDSGPDPGDGGELASYLDYFHANPGGAPRLPAGVHQAQLSYYKMSWGNADFYLLDSDHAVTDPIARATQRQWLKDQIRTSTAKWKFAVFHHPPFSSCSLHGNTQQMQWGADFEGLTAIFTGHDHTYERLDIGYGVTQFVAGLGGNSFYSFGSTPVTGSLFRYNANHGALKVTAGTQGVQFEFRAIGGPGGNIIDSHTIGTPPGPVQASGSDTWPLRVQPGHILKLATRTPQAPGALTNSINPSIQLLDASGAVVASDAGSAADGINASLTFTVPALPEAPPEGVLWSVRVANESAGSGEYELSLSQPAGNPYAEWAAANLPSLPAGAQDDPDRDGAPNLMEFLAGSDPRVTGSTPPLTTVPAAGGGLQIQLNLPSDWTAPVTAGLQSSSSLTAGSWKTVATKNPGNPWTAAAGGSAPVAAAGGGFVLTVPSGPRQFYRLIFSTQ